MSNEEESLLALLCESLSNGQRGNAPIFINFNSFNGPVGQHNDHVDTVNFSMDKDGVISFQHVRRTCKSIIQPEVMAKALERTMEEGYWWASTAWAVAYRIYQMEGFTGSIRQFEREVQEWPWQKTLAFPCTYDSIQKPIVSGKLSGSIDRWIVMGTGTWAVPQEPVPMTRMYATDTGGYGCTPEQQQEHIHDLKILPKRGNS